MSAAVRAVAASVALFALVTIAGCTAAQPSDSIPPPPATPLAPSSTPVEADGFWRPVRAPETLASGLEAPWSVVPLDSGGALVSQRDDGAILEASAAGDLRTVGVVPGVVSGGESGLHGLALWSEGDERWLYAYHGAADDNRVVRMPLRGATGSLEVGDPEVVLEGIARNSTHNGGRLAFGPDGMLYVTTGDAQDRDASQDPDALNGKILRVTPEGRPAPGNPFGNAVYSLGHRNVQGIAWTSDGTMWASEFGQNRYDELNRIQPGGNYGWPVVEGTGDDERYIDPVVTWATSDASPSGIAAVGGTVFMAGLRGERLWILDTSGEALAREPVALLEGEQGRLRDVVAAPDGSLRLLTSNTDGRGSPRAGDDVLLRLDIAPEG